MPSVDQLFLAGGHQRLEWLADVEANYAAYATYGYDPAELEDHIDYLVDAYEWTPVASGVADDLADRYAGLVVSWPVDLTQRPHTMAAVPVNHATFQLEPGQAAGLGVSTFPGLVDPLIPRLSGELRTVDFDQPDPRYLEVPVEPRMRLSTGLYALRARTST